MVELFEALVVDVAAVVVALEVVEVVVLVLILNVLEELVIDLIIIEITL